MNEETAKTASELLKQKSELLDDLSKILDKPKQVEKSSPIYGQDYYYLSLCYGYSGGVFYGGSKPSLNVNNNRYIVKKVLDLLVTEINKEIEKIDEKLKNLTC